MPSSFRCSVVPPTPSPTPFYAFASTLCLSGAWRLEEADFRLRCLWRVANIPCDAGCQWRVSNIPCDVGCQWRVSNIPCDGGCQWRVSNIPCDAGCQWRVSKASCDASSDEHISFSAENRVLADITVSTAEINNINTQTNPRHPCLMPLASPCTSLISTLRSMYNLINLLSRPSIRIHFRICIRLVHFTQSNTFCQPMKQVHSSSSITKVRSDIFVSIPTVSLIHFPLQIQTGLLHVHPQFFLQSLF